MKIWEGVVKGMLSWYIFHAVSFGENSIKFIVFYLYLLFYLIKSSGDSVI